RWAQELRQLEVIEADERDAAVSGESAQRAGRESVVAGEDRSRRLSQREQLAHGGLGAPSVVRAEPDQLGIEGDARRVERLAVALVSLLGGRDGRLVGDDRDSPVSVREQVLDRR